MRMILKVLFIQRKEAYEGQHAPEAVAVVDEFTYDENPQAFHSECEVIIADIGNELAGHEVIDIEVDQSEIRRRILGETHPLSGVLK